MQLDVFIDLALEGCGGDVGGAGERGGYSCIARLGHMTVDYACAWGRCKGAPSAGERDERREGSP